jgi:biopolymer transport protein ExbD
MAEQPKKFFDVWFVAANNVFKEVPYHIVTDWIQQGKVREDDRVKPSGTAAWFQLGSVSAFQPYFSPAEEFRSGDVAEALEPVEMDVEWSRRRDEEDDDVDMIPLIDIALVLLIFFMMTMTVSAISRITVPDMQNAIQIESNPGTLRIDIDFKEGKPVYSLGIGTSNPLPEDDNLTSDVEVLLKLDERLKSISVPPKVRIAAHGDLRYEIVEEVMKGLERRVEKGQLEQYTVEVNEAAK